MSRVTGGPLLIIVIDEDNDVGVKGGVETPIIGRDANQEAALKLVLADPEDADANAMFAAIKLYDEEYGKWPNGVELVTVAGSPKGGLERDRKIAQEIEDVIARIGSTECIVVSDGPLSPSASFIISSRLKVVSARTVVVKQSQSIETSWMIFLRYLRMLVYEAPYTRMILGIPGIILIVLGMLYFFNLLTLTTLLIFAGIVMLIRGFGLDNLVASLLRHVTEISHKPGLTQIRIFTATVSLILILVALAAGYSDAMAHVQTLIGPDSGAVTLDKLSPYLLSFTGVFIKSSVDLLAVAAFLNTAYNIFYYYVARSARVWRHVQALVVFFFLWIIVRLFGEYLVTQNIAHLIQLILVVIVGFATLLTTITIIRSIRRVRVFKR